MEAVTVTPHDSGASTPLSRPGRDPFMAVRHLCRDDLEAVEREIAAVLRTDTELLNEVGRYLGHSAGKLLRPILTLLSAQACGGAPALHVRRVAAAMELVHTATLLHDDVIDNSSLRRGKPTINARFGQDIAILMADYLYANAFDLSLEALKPEVLRMICKVTSKMAEGELFQIEKRDALLTEDDYYRIIKAKTAYLFSACCGLGGVVAGVRRAKVEALTEFGMQFGLAFQVTDDILDYVADEKVFGKAIGTDISSGKQTLPFLRTLTLAEAPARDRLVDALKAHDVPTVLAAVERHGGIESARETARAHVAKGLAALDRAGRGPAVDALRGIAEHVLERTY